MEDGYTQAVHGLVRKRTEITSELAAVRLRMDKLVMQMDIIDQSIRILSPHIDFETLPGPKLPRSNVAFRGEILRYCSDLFRQAEGPLSTADIATAVMRARGLDVSNPDLRRTMTHRIGSTLRKMRERGYVRNCGTIKKTKMSLWELVPLE